MLPPSQLSPKLCYQGNFHKHTPSNSFSKVFSCAWSTPQRSLPAPGQHKINPEWCYGVNFKSLQRASASNWGFQSPTVTVLHKYSDQLVSNLPRLWKTHKTRSFPDVPGTGCKLKTWVTLTFLAHIFYLGAVLKTEPESEFAGGLVQRQMSPIPSFCSSRSGTGPRNLYCYEVGQRASFEHH